MLYNAFGWKAPRFAHLPLLLSDQGGKLSKRHADASVKSFVSAGYQPEALVNFVAFLGWTPDGTDFNEVMDMNQLVQAFSLERVHKGGAAVSRAKLDFLNAKHIEKLLAKAPGRAILKERFFPFVSHLTSDADYALAVFEKIYTRLSPMAAVASRCSYFFRDPDLTTPEALAFREKALREPDSSVTLKLLAPRLAALSSWTATSIAECVATLEGSALSKSQIMQTLRFKLTGSTVGAGMPETMQLLGRDAVLRRINQP
jgi:glutamyl/glutaminyl-tRNA synthetase